MATNKVDVNKYTMMDKGYGYAYDVETPEKEMKALRLEILYNFKAKDYNVSKLDLKEIMKLLFKYILTYTDEGVRFRTSKHPIFKIKWEYDLFWFNLDKVKSILGMMEEYGLIEKAEIKGNKIKMSHGSLSILSTKEELLNAIEQHFTKEMREEFSEKPRSEIYEFLKKKKKLKIKKKSESLV